MIKKVGVGTWPKKKRVTGLGYTFGANVVAGPERFAAVGPEDRAEDPLARRVGVRATLLRTRRVFVPGSAQRSLRGVGRACRSSSPFYPEDQARLARCPGS